MSIFDYENEEEQIAAIKSWWKENWLITVVAVSLSLGAYFGYNIYKNSKAAETNKASYLYDSLSEAGDDGDAIIKLASDLKAEYPESQYAHFAALNAAKLAVEQKDYETAATELQWVIDNKPDALTQSIAKLRLARVFFQQNRYDAALALVDNADTGFEASYLELKGDIYRDQGKVVEARAAYENAIAVLDGANANTRPYLQYKLDDIAVSN